MRHFVLRLILAFLICTFGISAVNAQIIDMETFGTGTYPGPELPAGQTNQIYNPIAQPADFPDILEDGEYVIATDTQQGFTNWASVGDNTTGTGYMMLINAGDNNAGEFYRRRVTLTANTTFDFLTYAINVNSQTDFDFCDANADGLILPNVRLQIEDVNGNIIAFSDTGDIPFDPNPDWEEYELTFATNASTTEVDVVLLNNSVGGCGNDLAIDDITFRVSVTMEAVADTITINDTTTQQNNILFVGANDSLDGNALPGTELYFIDPPASLPSELLFDTNTGGVSVAAGTPSGTYSFEYRVCETANEFNCDTTTVTVVVDLPPAVISAQNDNGSVPDSSTGNTLVLNVLSNDAIDGQSPPSNFDLALAPGETLPAGLVFDTDTGEVTVLQGTPTGTLSFDYQLCEAGDPNNCETASVTLNVTNPAPPSICPIGSSPILGTFHVAIATGGNNPGRAVGEPLADGASVTDNDTGVTFSPDVIYDLTDNQDLFLPEGASIQLALGNRFFSNPTATISASVDGMIYTSIGSSTGPWTNNTLRHDTYIIPAGGARFIEIDPSNGGLRFDGAIFSSLCGPVPDVSVEADDDTGSVADSSLGFTPVLNVLDNDSIDGISPPSNFDLSFDPTSLPAGLSFDTATGEVGVLQGAPTGIFSFDYVLCEAGNPLNCRMASVTINVTNPNPPSICPFGTIATTGSFHVITAESATQDQSITNAAGALGAPETLPATANNNNSGRTFNADVLYDLTGDSDILIPEDTVIDVALANFFGNNPTINISTSLDNINYSNVTTATGFLGNNQLRHVSFVVPSAGARYMRLDRGNNTSFRFDGVIYDTQCTVSTGPLAPDVSVSKTVQMFVPEEYAIPGNDVLYTITFTNSGDGIVDADSIDLIDIMPSEIEFYNDDIDGPVTANTDPISFVDNGSGLTLDFANDVKFSNAATRPENFNDCDYTPGPNAYDGDVSFICFNPKGEMNPQSSWSVSFRARLE